MGKVSSFFTCAQTIAAHCELTAADADRPMLPDRLFELGVRWMGWTRVHGRAAPASLAGELALAYLDEYSP